MGTARSNKNKIDFNKMPSTYWSIVTKIEYLQRCIIIYSIMYYENNESCVTDQYYDGISKQLMEYKNKYPEAYSKSEYYYAMDDFDGNTGFDIPSRLNEKDSKRLHQYAKHIYKQWKGSNHGNKR